MKTNASMTIVTKIINKLIKSIEPKEIIVAAIVSLNRSHFWFSLPETTTILRALLLSTIDLYAGSLAMGRYREQGHKSMYAYRRGRRRSQIS
jgi:hypothetical protein